MRVSHELVVGISNGWATELEKPTTRKRSTRDSVMRSVDCLGNAELRTGFVFLIWIYFLISVTTKKKGRRTQRFKDRGLTAVFEVRIVSYCCFSGSEIEHVRLKRDTCC